MRAPIPLSLVAFIIGCGTEPECAPASEGRVVTADYLNRSLTVFDRGRLASGRCDAAQAMVGGRPLDLAEWAPGPLQVELTPDGTRAVVAVGPGFFAGGGQLLIGAPEPPPGGALLVVSLEPFEVLATIPTAHVPMGIAVAPDGARAYTANFGDAQEAGTTLTVVDLVTLTRVSDVEVGSQPEQVALSPDGTLGIVNLTSGFVRVFETADVAGSLSAPLAVGTDPSDVTFVPGTPWAVVVNSVSTDMAVVDVTDPAAPEVHATVSLAGHIPYGVTWVPGTSTVLVTTLLGPLVPVDLAADPPAAGAPMALPGGPFPLTVAVDPLGAHGFVPHPRDRLLSVVDLATREATSVEWLDEPGPTWAAAF
jgi:YVTN family beta-propeller protein